MKPVSHEFTTQIGNQGLVVETGKLAGLAGGAVTVTVGDTKVFAAATMSESVRTGINYFPLTVDFEERMYAGGRIPGGFFRREGRPSEMAVLTARLTDRTLRPLFAHDLRNDVQVVIYAFSADEHNPIDVLAVNAASAALMISDVPWQGPVGAVRVGLINGELIINPTFSQIETSDLDLRLAGTRDAILMVECGANEVPDDLMVGALQFGHQAIQPLIDLQEKMTAAIGKAKRMDYLRFAPPESLKTALDEGYNQRLRQTLDENTGKSTLNTAIQSIQVEAVAAFAKPDGEPTAEIVAEAFDSIYKAIVRERILQDGRRPDGRSKTEIRPIWCEVDFSPRAHGSGIFTRGETQIVTLATLGTPRDAQELDNLTPIDKKRYIHHYNFPPFSTGEVRPMRGASRREVGHGALAERALVPVIPSEQTFPYTLRLVSEALSSNGSTSMGSVCGSTLALMDAGVPIKAPVAGIAMGLVKDGERYAILSDIQGVEDHLGDMDFKVAGTRKGITALQMDIKISGLTAEIMDEALRQANLGREHILSQMLEVMPAPRPDLKPHTPRIEIVKIPVDKIGAVIGPGGKMIRSIQEETGAKIDIEEDGSVYIATNNGESARRAREIIQGLTEVPMLGRIYTGTVKRVAEFGAFVEILPGQDGLVHISQLDSEPVQKVEDVANLGDEITVMVTNIDSEGKVRLSRQAVLEGWTLEEAQEKDRGGRGAGGGRGRSDGGRRPGGGNRGGERRSGGYDRNRR